MMRLRMSVCVLFLSSSSIAMAQSYFMIGDSILATRSQEVKRLIEIEKDIHIQNQAFIGAWSWQIVRQYERLEVKAGDVVIMDGGANDVIGNTWNCRGNMNDKCIKLMGEINDRFESLLQRMYEDGISKVVFLSCYYPRGDWHQPVDFGTEGLKAVCENALVDCRFVDVRTKIKYENLEWDGLHPNGSGTKILAMALGEQL